MSAGLFDPTLVAAGWFDPVVAEAAGWFDEDLVAGAAPQIYTLEAAAGAVTVAGAAASLELDRVVGAGAAAASGEGAAAGLRLDRVVIAGAGAAGAVAEPVTFLKGRIFAALSGAIAVVGGAAVLRIIPAPPAPVATAATRAAVALSSFTVRAVDPRATDRPGVALARTVRRAVEINATATPVVIVKGDTMAGTYYAGSRVRLEATFKLPSGALVDPSVVRFLMRYPGLNGEPVRVEYVYGTDVELVRDGIGTFHVELLPAFIGAARYRWESTGQAQESADEGEFTMLPRGV